MATYTVTNSFSADTTAVASQVNQNFTDVLTALNSFDAANLTGTISLARISNLTSTQMASTYFLDEDNMTSNSATAVSSQQAIVAYIAAIVTYSAYTANDSEANAMVKAHAYLAATDGFVTAHVLGSGNGQYLRGYIDGTNDPAGAGEKLQGSTVDAGEEESISFSVAAGEYFEITTDSTNEPTIYWRSKGTLSEPIDQD